MRGILAQDSGLAETPRNTASERTTSSAQPGGAVEQVDHVEHVEPDPRCHTRTRFHDQLSPYLRLRVCS